MTRENIISLARECGVWFHDDVEIKYQAPGLEAFYHKAQREAFEAAYNAADNAYATGDVLLAIREMAKEKQNG